MTFLLDLATDRPQTPESLLGRGLGALVYGGLMWKGYRGDGLSRTLGQQPPGNARQD